MGGQYGGTLLNGWSIRRRLIKWADNTAELYLMGGQCGGTLLNGWTIRRKFTKWVGGTYNSRIIYHGH